jgi:DNA-directed RNA polymerase subunit RPC12/RpoP
MEFFRHCPGCGRRFHIKLESRKLVDVERELIPTEEVVTGSYRYIGSGPPIVMVEGKPIIVKVEEFEYAYKCHHCGHEWAEKHFKKQILQKGTGRPKQEDSQP